MITAMANGLGVDSTAMMAVMLYPAEAAALLDKTEAEVTAAIGKVDVVVTADTGGEFPDFYENAATTRKTLAAAAIPYVTVRKDGGAFGAETLPDMMMRLGSVPLTPGSSHTCSIKYKTTPMRKWATKTYPGETITWLIGIEANETHRKRFKSDDTETHFSKYPLIELDLTRADCEMLVRHFWPIPVRKSSCYFCPFMSEPEIKEMIADYPDLWAKAKAMEANYKATSPVKHKAWIDAGKPLTKGKKKRAPAGMWREDSWAKGGRLFAKAIDGKRLTVEEWEARFAEEPAKDLFDFNYKEAA